MILVSTTALALPPGALDLSSPPKRPPRTAPGFHPWHAIGTRFRRELEVAASLAPFSLQEVYCPTYQATWVRHHRPQRVTLPYLAGRVFARWDAEDARLWHAIRGLSHVTGFLGGYPPAPIPDREMTALQDFVGTGDGPVVQAIFSWVPRVNDPVRVISGPFRGYSGRVLRSGPASSVIVVEIFGLLSCSVGISLPVNWCEPADDDVNQERGATPSGTSRGRQRGRRGGSPRESGRFHFTSGRRRRSIVPVSGL